MAFNARQYVQNKRNQLNETGSTAGGHTGQWSDMDVHRAFSQGGLTPRQHYQRYGKDEGISPYGKQEPQQMQPPNVGTYRPEGNNPIPMPSIPMRNQTSSVPMRKPVRTAGNNPGTAYGVGGTNTAQPQGPELFQPDLYPTSRSSSVSGIDFSNPYVQKMTGGILDRIGGLDAQTDASYDNAVSGARDVSRDQITGTTNNMLRNLTNRGILDSSFAPSAVGTALGNLAQGTQQNVYNAGVSKAQQKFNTPSMLAGLAQLGQRSTSSSLNEDRSAPYRNVMDFYSQMMR